MGITNSISKQRHNQFTIYVENLDCQQFVIKESGALSFCQKCGML